MIDVFVRVNSPASLYSQQDEKQSKQGKIQFIHCIYKRIEFVARHTHSIPINTAPAEYSFF